MPRVLVFCVRLHEGRYHGAGDWPPSPARLFQALIAGAGTRGPLRTEQVSALQWLECCDPPVIAAPPTSTGQSMQNFVPNNDLDAIGGDPKSIGAIRTKKVIRPRLFDATIPFYYGWPLGEYSEAVNQLDRLCRLADALYQFGRGVDFAWAIAEILEEEEFERQLEEYPGVIYRPTLGGVGGIVLQCPANGSFLSLETRYNANKVRFEAVHTGRSVSQSFRRQPKSRFKSIGYDCPPSRRIFELRDLDMPEKFGPWSLDKVYSLTIIIRDNAVQRLVNALPSYQDHIDRWLIGRRPDGSNGGSSDQRIRLIPLPSIGHEHSDYKIRRLLVEVPAGCPLRTDDVFWAFSGLRFDVAGSGAILTLSSDDDMAQRYLAKAGATSWQSVTPVALPESAARRRIEPSRRLAEAKAPMERAQEQMRAASAVVNALRHAKVRSRVEQIIIQREPFTGQGQRVELFAEGSRFSKERLWHVGLSFAEPYSGPIIIGDGRFCGLGILAPVN